MTPKLIPGAIYESKTHGLCEYKRADHCLGQGTLEFLSVEHGRFYILPSALSRHFDMDHENDGQWVDLPKNDNQAEAMLRVAMSWLEERAPHRLRKEVAPTPKPPPNAEPFEPLTLVTNGSVVGVFMDQLAHPAVFHGRPGRSVIARGGSRGMWLTTRDTSTLRKATWNDIQSMCPHGTIDAELCPLEGCGNMASPPLPQPMPEPPKDEKA